MNVDLLFLNFLIQALKTKSTDILNMEWSSLGGSTGVLVVGTGIRAIPAIDPKTSQNTGFCSLYLILDKTNRTTFPFLSIGNTDTEVRNQINENINLVQSNSGGVMVMGATNQIRVISSNDLTPTMNTLIRSLNGSSYEALFGSETIAPDVRLAKIVYQSYISIIQFINLYRLNAMNLFTSQIHDPNTDIILSNGQIILPNGLQAVLTNVFNNPQTGAMEYNIYFTLNYNLQRSGKNDLMYS